MTYEELNAVWERAVIEFDRRNPNRDLNPAGIYDGEGTLYVNKGLVKMFRDMLLKEFKPERSRGMDIREIFTAEGLKLLGKALAVYRKCNWPDDESKALIDKVERLRKYVKADRKMEQIELELK